METESTIHRQRRRKLQCNWHKKLLRTFQEALVPKKRETIDIDGHCITTLDGLRFLLFDINGSDRIIAFVSDRQLEILSRSKKWHSDGTFKSSPDLFAQHHIIHGWYEERLFPCVSVLTPDSKEGKEGK